MNEALILEKLDRLSDEVKALKSEIRREPEQSVEPVLGHTRAPASGELPEGGGDTGQKVALVAKSLLLSLEQLNEVLLGVKAEAGGRGEVVTVDPQAQTESLQFLAGLDEEFQFDDLIVLLRKTLTNLDTMGEGLEMLRAGVELRDELLPIIKLMYPRILRFLNSLHEGEFQAEKLGDLLHTVLINIHTLSDLLNMIQPMTELVKEVGVLLKETDVINGMNIWLDGLQQGNGFVRLAGTIITTLRRLDLTEEQANEICLVISGVEFNKVQPVGLLGMMKQMNDPKVKEALGFMFMILQATGSCLQTCRTEAESG